MVSIWLTSDLLFTTAADGCSALIKHRNCSFPTTDKNCIWATTKFTISLPMRYCDRALGRLTAAKQDSSDCVELPLACLFFSYAVIPCSDFLFFESNYFRAVGCFFCGQRKIKLGTLYSTGSAYFNISNEIDLQNPNTANRIPIKMKPYCRCFRRLEDDVLIVEYFLANAAQHRNICGCPLQHRKIFAVERPM